MKAAVLGACVGFVAVSGCVREREGGWVEVAADGSGLVCDGRPFLAWGFNYDRSVIDGRDVILEDILREQPARLDRDFGAMRRMGGNTVRLFCQMGEYFRAPDQIDPAAVERLAQAIDAAERNGLKVILVGLCHIRKSAIPRWLLDADDETVERNEALFWRAVAGRLKDHPAILAYDLQNEPAVHGGDSRELVIGCFPMRAGEPFCYVHMHGREARRRWTEWVHARYETPERLQSTWRDFPRDGETWETPELPRPAGDDPRRGDQYAQHAAMLQQWASRMKRAVREVDRRHLITVGPLDPAVFAEVVDFHCAHLYPQANLTLQGNVDAWRKQLDRLPPGKPIVVEEFFPLAMPKGLEGGPPGAARLIAALREAVGPRGTGFISFYWGPAEEVQENPFTAALYTGWLDAWSRGSAGTPVRP